MKADGRIEQGTRNKEQRPENERRRRKGDDIAKRMRSFAGAVLRLLPKLDHHFAAKHVARQLARSATGGGSNYEEARGAESHADFIHKIRVAAKELREACYWLQLLEESGYLDDPRGLDALIAEADELIAILTASARTAKARQR